MVKYNSKHDNIKTKLSNEIIFQSIGEGVMVVDKEGVILSVNRAFEEFTGWKSAEVVGKEAFNITLREDESGNRIPYKEAILTRVLAGEKITTTTTTGPTFYYIRKDRTRFPISSVITPVVIENEIIGAVEVFRDITKEKEVDQVKKEFISIASHQLRTPVSGLNWLVEALEFTSKNFDNEQKTYTKNFTILAKRLTELVED